MKCHRCSREATQQVTEIENGVPRTLWFCPGHGREHARQGGRPQDEPFFDEWTVIPVTVMRSQVEAEEAVAVELPEGGTQRLKLRRRWSGGQVLIPLRPGPRAETCRPLRCFRIRGVH